MGRGHGGYTEIQDWYKDSGGKKVIDKGSIFVAEQYIRQGYESVFRQQHDYRTLDLTIKTSDDKEYIKNIEVKSVHGNNASQIASQIDKARGQIREGDTVAIYLPNRCYSQENIDFAKKGVDEARRKGFIKGPIEVWFADKKSISF